MKDAPSVPKTLPRRKRKRAVNIHESYLPKNQLACASLDCKDDDENDEDEVASYTSYSSMNSSVSSLDDDDDEVEAWRQDYVSAKSKDQESMLADLKVQMAALAKETFPKTFVGDLRRKEHAQRIEALGSQIKQLEQLTMVDVAPLANVDLEECEHCGVVGMCQINVHKCIRHCMNCHRETPVEHFYETTGTNLVTTNPGRYTRREQFIKTLKKIQGQLKVTLPPTLLGEVKRCFEVHFGATCPKDIDYHNMKNVLGMLGYHDKKERGDYTDHIMTIYCQLTNRDPPRFSIKENQTLISDFDAMRLVFEQACYDLGIRRTNWLSYEFTIFKLCEKNKYTAMKKWFGILKGNTTRKNQDKVIERMFQLLGGEAAGWPFVKTESPNEHKERKPRKAPAPTAPTPRVLDMFSFVEHHKPMMKAPIQVLRIDEHIMSTDEEDNEEECQASKKTPKPKKNKQTKEIQEKRCIQEKSWQTCWPQLSCAC